MGLYWRKDLVDWRGQAGRLLGTEKGSKRAGEVDFAEQVGVYALYAGFRLVYVGRANVGKNGCLGRRLKQHTVDHLAGRWDTFSWFGLKRVTAGGLGKKFDAKPSVPWDTLVGVLEGVIIEIAEPPQNSQGGCLRDVRQYLQVPWVDPQEDMAKTVKYVTDVTRYLRTQAWFTKSTAKSKKRKESMLDAAARVLEDADRPMSCKELLAELPKRVKEKSSGKTPVQTLSAAIGNEIKKKGLRSRFRKVERGKYAHYMFE